MPRGLPIRLIGWLSVVSVLVWVSGCDAFRRARPPDEQEIDRQYRSVYASKAYADTVAAEAYYQGMTFLRVRGHGLVAGLGEAGSRECPRAIREQLAKELARLAADPDAAEDLRGLTIDKLLADRDTAIVEVVGDIPAGMTGGRRFDVQVRALPGTQTTSLEGGWLYKCDLKLYSPSPTGGLTEGKTVAHAAGPIFVNPLSDQERAGEVTRREGLVLGGGVSLEDRRIRLVLTTPSYMMAVRIARRINSRFGGDFKIADALSPGLIGIRLPPAYRTREKYFLSLISHTFLYDSSSFLDQRVRELLEELQEADASYDDVVMALQCVGRPAVPLLRELYTHRSRTVAYQSARAGLRLGDELAISVLAEQVRQTGNPWREQAIRELGISGKRAAAPPLRPLLDDPDQRVRILAYQALLDLQDVVIQTQVLGRRNLILDVVDSSGPHLVYARRTEEPRLVLFGREMRCQPPLFYAFRDQLVTLNAERDADTLTLIRRTPYRRLVSDPISVSLRVADVARRLAGDPLMVPGGEVEGVGLSYSQVVETLQALCRQGVINADFRIEGTVIAEMWPEQPPLGRKEAEFD